MPTGKVKLIGVETKDGLYKVLLKICSGEANVVKEYNCKKCHEQPVPCDYEMHEKSLPYSIELDEMDIGNKNDEVCKPCLLGRAVGAPRKWNPDKSSMTRPIGRIHANIVEQIKKLSLSRER